MGIKSEHKLSFFIKSYKPDLIKFMRLIRSIAVHNVDNIPVVVSVPEEDYVFFTGEQQKYGFDLLKDDQICGGRIEGVGWCTQQIVKLLFHQVCRTPNYFWIDSDFRFIKDFSEEDFIYSGDTPYTVIYQPEFFYTQVVLQHLDPEILKTWDGVQTKVRVIQDVINRPGPRLSFGAPVVWSVKVVRSLIAFLESKGMSVFDAIALAPYEMNWYGEYLLKTQEIDIIPHGPYAWLFTRDAEVEIFRRQRITHKTLANDFLAVSYASKWMSDSVSL